jgi:RimJ/RimL family protein N-acetyltransferase
MSIAVRPVDLDVDAGAMVKVLAANVNPAYDQARFDWLYRHNPDGRARAWALVNPGTGELAGTAAAIPRRMLVAGDEERAWILSDFCVSEGHRALGPALRLQRACLESVNAGKVPFCYDFPSESMMAIYRRLGLTPLGQLRRFVRPLRVDARVSQVVGRQSLGRIVSAGGNLVLRLMGPRRRSRRGLDVQLHQGRCGTEFSVLARQGGAHGGVTVLRSAEYLNWRFLDNPFRHHEILTVRRRQTLLGYAVIASERDAAAVVDLFGLLDTIVIEALVGEAVARLRGRGVTAVSVSLLDSHPWTTMFSRLGFWPREACPVIAYVPMSSASRVRTAAPHSWLLTQGDRDS